MGATTSYSPSGQGGYLLPAGYLSTMGNQIVDSNGNPVRVDSIGMDGPDGAAGRAITGLSTVSYETLLDSVKADGFNTIRVAWSDVDLTATPTGGTSYPDVNFTLNPDLKGLNTLQIFQKMVAYAGSIGLKIIFDHHTDDGGPGGAGGQQANGLWFDSGPGSDGTDGSGTNGTVTAAKFEQDWVTLAKTFAGNSTVIGFDLDNEPIAFGDTANAVNWGGGGPDDIRTMYETIGNAVQLIDPGALIICEGPIQVSGASFAGGPPNMQGDLSMAGLKPVVLNTPNKVVYSVHDYPATIFGAGALPDSGPDAVANMNAAWGYLESQNIAPVWIGEMGGSLDGTSDSTGAGLVDEQAWAATLLGYMNGQDGAQGGPTFTGNQQPISGSWWVAGSEPGQITDGIQSAWGLGNYRPQQQAITDQMLFIPKGTPTVTPPLPSADTFTLRMSEEAYLGDAEFTVKVDGTQVGGVLTSSALHATGDANVFVLSGNWGSGTQDVQLNFINDAYGGTTAKDRNLYVNSIAYDGVTYGNTTASMTVTGTRDFSVGGSVTAGTPPADTLTLYLSEDAYNGNAEFQLTIDGKQISTPQNVNTPHSSGAWQALTFAGNFGAGTHTIGVQFTNDAFGGTATTDRNLYVNGIDVNGQHYGTGVSNLFSNGSALFSITTTH